MLLSRLPGSRYKVLVALYRCGASRGPVMVPYGRLVDMCGCSERTIIRAIHDLAAAGLLTASAQRGPYPRVYELQGVDDACL